MAMHSISDMLITLILDILKVTEELSEFQRLIEDAGYRIKSSNLVKSTEFVEAANYHQITLFIGYQI